MKFRTFATALLAGVFLASPVLAADQHFLADRHVAKGVKCESCHNPGAASSKNVTPQNCLKCHGGSYEKLAEQTAGGDINYHNTHLGPIACTECHQGHKPPKLVCDQCHEFSVKVP